MVTSIVRIKKVMEMTGLARATVYKLIKEGKFPEQVRISKSAVGWTYESVLAWINSRTNDLEPKSLVTTHPYQCVIPLKRRFYMLQS